MTEVTHEEAIEIALAHLRSALALLDAQNRHVEAAMTDHVIQMIETADVIAQPA
jgi:hypothetical protein